MDTLTSQLEKEREIPKDNERVVDVHETNIVDNDNR